MDPALRNGEYILVNKLIYAKLDTGFITRILPFIDSDENSVRYIFRAPRRGDVVVFRLPQDPSRDFIKRIIGEPGDVVEIRMGTVYINGLPLDEPYITHKSNDTYGPLQVPKGYYFVLGDNRGSSSDSRAWGPVPEENIIGQAWFSYWPPSQVGLAPNYSVAARGP